MQRESIFGSRCVNSSLRDEMRQTHCTFMSRRPLTCAVAEAAAAFARALPFPSSLHAFFEPPPACRLPESALLERFEPPRV